MKGLLAQSGVFGGLVDEQQFNLDHHRRDSSIELRERESGISRTLEKSVGHNDAWLMTFSST